MSTKKTILFSLFILLVGVIVTVVIFSTEPTAERGGATKKTAMLVDVIEAEKGTYSPRIRAMGAVEPSKDIILSPRVGGEILRRTEAFTPGGHVRKGELLLQIDPADYRNVLQQRKSDLRQAVADLNIEMGRQNVAQKDYQLLDENLSQEQEELILRKPQLNAARSGVEAARAAASQAELDLQRTTIEAPFDAQILSRNVNMGSQVARGDNLGRLVGVETYWVEATVPLSKLRWLEFPKDQTSKGSPVRVRNRSAWQPGEYRQGYLYKLVGSLENQTRMARVLVSVSDPLGYEKQNQDVPALMIGSYVEANIRAREIPGVIRLNRGYVRDNETVWVMEDKKLHIRDVEIVFRDDQYAYIQQGLNEGEKIVTTNLSTVVEGAPLRTESDSTGVGGQPSDSLSQQNENE
ncbi:MAG: efflux RND transporter periplasmic adaptor subunit [Bacteroidales bacterium]|nr:efflux RND transporter periplasmic adaptor subunit [Bacteroidales bacterium]